MSNLSVIAVYIPFIVGSILIIVSVVGKDMGKQVLRDYLYFCLSLLGWQVSESLFYILNQATMMEWDYNFKLFFISMAGVFIFRLIVGFYKLNRVPSWVSYAIFIIPVITLILCFTDSSSQLLRMGFEVTSMSPLNDAVFVDGIWYWVNAVFANIMVIVSGIIVLMMHYRLPKAYRISSVAFMFALLFYALGYAFSSIFDSPIDFIMLGGSLSNLALYFVVAGSQRGDYLNIARREIFNYLDDAMFILDEKERIVDVNKAAREWLRLLGKDSIFVSFKGMLKSLADEGLVEVSPGDSENSLEIKLIHADILLVYKMTETSMYDEHFETKGKFITLEDVTRNSLFIDRLEIDAGMDPLTGLENRYTYEELLVDLDKMRNLPISVILGDVNSLKYINDNYGHMAGDALLSAAGDVIKECCPPNGHAARIGGDEFVIMVPNCDEDCIYKVAEEIEAKLKLIEDLPFEVNMALGSVTKSTLGNSLKSHVNEADKVMYINKTKIKEGTE